MSPQSPAEGETLSFRPFASAAANSNAAFWASYCTARPSPTEAFLQQILAYHAAHNGKHDVAHDVGTGPGNIAGRLVPYFTAVVASDVNDSALEAAPALLPTDKAQHQVRFVKAAAETLGTSALPDGMGVGMTDLVIVTECIPLLDQKASLGAFHTLLRPGGTLAIYFYGRPIFANGDSDKCNAVYERIATRICSFYLPFKGTPGEPFHRRSAEALVSFLDNVGLASEQWADIERHKWNADRPMAFNAEDGYDFAWEYVDRRAAGEKNFEVVDREFWTENWDLARVKRYLNSNYPKHDIVAGEKVKELDTMYEELESAMGGAGAQRKMTFPVCLIMASRK